MKTNINFLIKYLVSSLLLSNLISSAVAADDLMSLSDRKDRWEFSFQTRYLDSVELEFEGGAEATLNEELGWAFGLGYNYSEHWAFNFDMGWGDVGYSGAYTDENNVPAETSGHIYSSSANFGGIYHFTAKRFTPFIGASIGWTFIDTNIQNGPPQTGCWYYPYWGYICDTYIPTKTTTEFNYAALLGLRFDINNKVFLKASAGKNWLNSSHATSTPDITTYKFDIGFMF